jgi:hypothetical protein
MVLCANLYLYQRAALSPAPLRRPTIWCAHKIHASSSVDHLKARAPPWVRRTKGTRRASGAGKERSPQGWTLDLLPTIHSPCLGDVPAGPAPRIFKDLSRSSRVSPIAWNGLDTPG